MLLLMVLRIKFRGTTIQQSIH